MIFGANHGETAIRIFIRRRRREALGTRRDPSRGWLVMGTRRVLVEGTVCK